MLPSRFEYHRPESLEEAYRLLGQYGDDAKVLAGGQSLIPVMKLRLATPGHIVDISRLDMDEISESGDMLTVGALARHHDLERSDVIKSGYPVMAAAAPLISDPVVRNIGTIGGSLCHADPAGDWGSVMLALGASVVIGSGRGERELPVSEFLVDTFTTALEPDEILTQVKVPRASGSSGGTYLKLERKVGDFATVGVAVHVSFDNGKVGRAGIALTGVGASNLRARTAEEALAGAELDDDTIEAAAALAAEAAQPRTDHRGSADYKRSVVRVFTERGLRKAAETAAA